jgi:hypothetical protein
MQQSDNRPASNNSSTLDLPLAATRSFSALRQDFDVPWPPQSTGARQNKQPPASELLTALLKVLADRVNVEDNWYRKRYPDVEDGIRNGQFRSPKHHYVEFGYFEDRLPRYFAVDDKFYRGTYHDIAEYLDSGRLASSQEHFELYGFREGRLPWRDWRLVG